MLRILEKKKNVKSDMMEENSNSELVNFTMNLVDIASMPQTESDIMWYEESSESTADDVWICSSPRVSQLSEEMRQSLTQDNMAAADSECLYDMSNIKRVHNNDGTHDGYANMRCFNNDVSDSRIVPSSTKVDSTVSSSTDFNQIIKANKSHLDLDSLSSPSLFSDTDCELVNSSPKYDLPQFVLDCPRKPIINLQLSGRKGNETKDNSTNLNDESSSSLSPSVLAPSVPVFDFLDLTERDNLFGCGLKTRKLTSPQNKLRDNCVAKKGSKHSSSRLKLTKKNITKEIVITDSEDDAIKATSRIRSPNHFDFLDTKSSPLKSKAQKNFNVVDKVLISALLPTLKHLDKSDKVKKGLDATKKSKSSNNTTALKRSANSLLPDVPDENCSKSKNLQTSSHIFGTASTPLPCDHSKINRVTVPSNEKSGEKEVYIRIVPKNNCEGIQEIKKCERVGDNYICLKEVGSRRRAVSLKKSDPPSRPSNRQNKRCTSHHEATQRINPSPLSKKQSIKDTSHHETTQRMNSSGPTKKQSIKDTSHHKTTQRMNSSGPTKKQSIKDTSHHKTTQRMNSSDPTKQQSIKDTSHHKTTQRMNSSGPTKKQSIKDTSHHKTTQRMNSSGPTKKQSIKDTSHHKTPQHNNLSSPSKKQSIKDTSHHETTQRMNSSAPTKKQSIKDTSHHEAPQRINPSPPSKKQNTKFFQSTQKDKNATNESQGFVPSLFPSHPSNNCLDSPDPLTSVPQQISTQPFIPVLSNSFENDDVEA